MYNNKFYTFYKTYKLLIIIIFIIIVAYFTYAISIEYKFKESFTKKNYMLLGSVHGNEPVGHHVLKDLSRNHNYISKIEHFRNGNHPLNINNNKSNKSNIILHTPNKFGLFFNFRSAFALNPFNTDINRNFIINNKTNYEKNGKEPISNSIIKHIHEYNIDCIVDIHEAYHYNRVEHNSLGSTVTISKNASPSLKSIVTKMVDDVNTKASSLKNDQSKQFSIIERNNCGYDKDVCENEEKCGTLACYCEKNGIDYILIEITRGETPFFSTFGIKRDKTVDTIDLSERYEQAFILIDSFIKNFESL